MSSMAKSGQGFKVVNVYIRVLRLMKIGGQASQHIDRKFYRTEIPRNPNLQIVLERINDCFTDGWIKRMLAGVLATKPLQPEQLCQIHRLLSFETRSDRPEWAPFYIRLVIAFTRVRQNSPLSVALRFQHHSRNESAHRG